MDQFLWILLPVLVAAGTAILVYFLMEARAEVAIAKERENLAAAKAQLAAHETGLEDKIGPPKRPRTARPSTSF